MYHVTIYDVDDLGGGAKAFFALGGFSTSETSIPLPPGTLQEGKAHIFDITAMVDPATDPSHPLQHSVNHARASTLTNLVIP